MKWKGGETRSQWMCGRRDRHNRQKKHWEKEGNERKERGKNRCTAISYTNTVHFEL